MSFVIMTDSTANLTYDIIEKYNIEILPMRFKVGDKEYYSYKKGENIDLKQYYDMMRNKQVFTTSLVTPEEYKDAFMPFLENGQDLLFVCFSSALSSTFQSAQIAVSDLAEQFPERKIIAFDSLSAALGEGFLAYRAAKMREEGKTIEETVEWLENNKLHICHWFSVNDLFFLKKGGRVSATAAVVGTMLNIKPILHMDSDGKLLPVGVVRGRKQSLNALLKKFEETAINPKEQFIFLSHADCPEDAQYLEKQLREKYGIKDILTNYIDPVIGAHSGPGTIAIYFIGTQR